MNFSLWPSRPGLDKEPSRETKRYKKAKPPARRVKTPTVLQMEAVECGAASLAMILAYHGRIVPLEELRHACGVSRDGSKASNIVKAARSYGLIAGGYRRDPDGLKEMRFPMIIHWEFNHFVVLEGFKKGRVYLNDPGQGTRTVSEEEFDRSFTGIALTFEPGPDFRPGGVKHGLIPALRRRLSGLEPALAYVVLASLFLLLPGMAIPTFTRVFVDYVVVGVAGYWLPALLAGLGLTAVLQGALTWLQQYYLLRLETRLALSTSSRFFWHVVRLPVDFFSQRYLGDIGSRVALNDQVARLLSGDLASTAVNLVVVFFYLAIMSQYDLVLTAVAVPLALLNIAFLKYVSHRRVIENQKLLQETGKLSGVTFSGLQIIESIMASGQDTEFFNRWAGYMARVLRSEQSLGVTSKYLAVFPTLVTGFCNTAILAVGGLRILDGHLSIGMLVAFQGLIASFMGPFGSMVNLGATLQEVEGSMKRLDDVLQYPLSRELAAAGEGRAVGGPDTLPNGAPVAAPAAGEDEPGAVGETPAKLDGYVEFRNVTFGYSRLEPPLIEDFSMTLRPGDRVALVGGSGSGKSTLAKLLAGLYEPWSGAILFDGKPRQAWPRRVICNTVALVDQDISLFEGTIRENITLWDHSVPDAHVVRAAKDACIHDDIMARGGGYAHLVEEGGRNFSGGQRQRLEIARALAGSPTVLVLDEATSALDPVTEKEVDDSLRRRGCTCLIAAHRLSTIRDCDEIIVLENGKVAQRGTHEEMKDVEGPYARLIREQ
ncbi:NHLP family bacteriocin export ABC transporter peptidase/permease/ATPase subunit [Pelotomaculum propionicicum]|uniref:Lactococcin-G-processing and transport ATP-binding protein LagD n=1 Tax=Pelotomaculum propionicicum TaxID=258475 RepID=A0A4Y7RWN7_9FIRM|nr:NHLP family bacteriocin export ABC transporter peptidase/permease/ATPase subunit [Pelotomaculum propionicicum]TEB13180.1 Lactococcin-G-processing and transport ATP-binding protein LagD [Pelotomaculum propionicicum]